MKQWASSASGSPRFYLVSAAGGNLGDDLITIGWLRAIYDRYPDAEVFCDVSDPSLFQWTLSLFPELRPRVVYFAWQLARGLTGDRWQMLQNGAHAIQLARDPWARVLRELLSSCQQVHVLGGGFINDLWPGNLALCQLLAESRRLHNHRLVWTGGSIIPISEMSLFDISPAVAMFDYISCRDLPSWQLLSKINPHASETPDDMLVAMLAQVVRQPRELLETNVLVVSHQRDLYSAEDFQRNVTALRGLLNALAGENWRFIYPEMNVIYDRPGYEFLYSQRYPLEFVCYLELVRQLRDGTFPCGLNTFGYVTRFHLHMLLSWWGVSGRWLSTGDYYDNKHDLLKRYYGSPWERFDAESDITPPATVSESDRSTRWKSLADLKLEEVEWLYG